MQSGGGNATTTASAAPATPEPVRSTPAAATNAQQQRGGVNLQVLPKDIPRQELIAIMRSFNRSLGVKCNFCHVPAANGKDLDFPSDANEHKQIARVMIRMTQAINNDYIARVSDDDDDRVTCYTCHRGAEEPVNALPPLPADEGQQRPQ